MSTNSGNECKLFNFVGVFFHFNLIGGFFDIETESVIASEIGD